MDTSRLTIWILFIWMFAVLGCATHRISLDRAKDVRNQEDLVRMLGKPDRATKNQDGYEEWIYRSKTCNILRLEYTSRDFIFLLNKNGEVIRKDMSELLRKYRLMPLRKLPDEFKEFEWCHFNDRTRFLESWIYGKRICISAIKSTKHQDMKKGFSSILQITITEWNVVSWEKSVSRWAQEVMERSKQWGMFLLSIS